MTRETLEQYYDLNKELYEVRKRIKRTEETLDRISSEGVVIDTVTGGSGGIQHFQIEGFPMRDYSKNKTILLGRKAQESDLEQRLTQMVQEVEGYINNCPDSHARRIMSFRFKDGLSWEEVAAHIGGGNTEDSVRMYFVRYFEKNSPKI